MKLEKCFMCGAPAPSVREDKEEKSWGVECLACDSLFNIQDWGRAPTLIFMADSKKEFYENVETMSPSDFYLYLTKPPVLEPEVRALDSLSGSFYADRPEVLNVLLYFYLKVYGGPLNRPMLDRVVFEWKFYDFDSSKDAYAFCKKIFAMKNLKFTWRNFSL